METTTWRFRLYRTLILMTLLLLAARVWYVQGEQARAYGRFNAAQILARSEPLFRVIAPQATTLCLSADRDMRRERDGALRRCWTVECTDEAGHLVATLFWNADTGELSLVKC